MKASFEALERRELLAATPYLVQDADSGELGPQALFPTLIDVNINATVDYQEGLHDYRATADLQISGRARGWVSDFSATVETVIQSGRVDNGAGHMASAESSFVISGIGLLRLHVEGSAVVTNDYMYVSGDYVDESHDSQESHVNGLNIRAVGRYHIEITLVAGYQHIEFWGDDVDASYLDTADAVAEISIDASLISRTRGDLLTSVSNNFSYGTPDNVTADAFYANAGADLRSLRGRGSFNATLSSSSEHVLGYVDRVYSRTNNRSAYVEMSGSDRMRARGDFFTYSSYQGVRDNRFWVLNRDPVDLLLSVRSESYSHGPQDARDALFAKGDLLTDLFGWN